MVAVVGVGQWSPANVGRMARKSGQYDYSMTDDALLLLTFCFPDLQCEFLVLSEEKKQLARARGGLRPAGHSYSSFVEDQAVAGRWRQLVANNLGEDSLGYWMADGLGHC